MRTQLARVIDLDDDSWRLPRVDPTGWLARRPAADPDEAPAPAGGSVGGPAGGSVAGARRRPRRTAQARVARERELARRRRRRHGRAAVIGPPLVGRAAAGASPRRVVEPDEGGEYRIGRWGRMALTVLVVATLVLIAARLIAGLTAVAAEPVDVTVGPGDTLWSIAAQAAPDRDPRAVIDEIRELNQVSGDVVRVGEVLRVPVSPDPDR